MKKFIPLLISILLFGAVAVYFLTQKDDDPDTVPNTAIKIPHTNRAAPRRSFNEEKMTEQKKEKEPIKTSEKTAKTPDEKKNYMSQKQKIEAESRKMMTKILDETYADLYKDLNLSPERQAKLSGLLMDNQMELQKMLMNMMNPNVTDEEILSRHDELAIEQQGSLNEVLDSSEQQKLDAYQKELPNKTGAKMASAMFEGDGAPLTKEDQMNMGKLLQEQGAKISGTPEVFRTARNQMGYLDQESLAKARAFMKESMNPAHQKEQAKKMQDFHKNFPKLYFKKYGKKVKLRGQPH